MKVKCIDTSGSLRITMGAIYEVEEINNNGDFYKLVGVPASWHKDRFEVLRQVKCIDVSATFPMLYKGVTYHVVDSDARSYRLAEVKRDYEYDKRRFVDVVEEAPTLRSAQQPIVKQDDSNAELNFFKRRTFGNECPCGSTRGVCPDHP